MARDLGLGVTRRHETLVSSLKALPRNLSCRPRNEGCVKAERRSAKASSPDRCLWDTDRSVSETLIKSQSQILQEFLYIASS